MLFYTLLSFAVAQKKCSTSIKVRGSRPSTCNDGEWTDICYSQCKKGYVGVGPVCWEECSTLGKRLGKDNCSNGGALCYCPPFDFPLKKYYAREIIEQDCRDTDHVKIDGYCFLPCNRYPFQHTTYKFDSVNGKEMTCKVEWTTSAKSGACWYDW